MSERSLRAWLEYVIETAIGWLDELDAEEEMRGGAPTARTMTASPAATMTAMGRPPHEG